MRGIRRVVPLFIVCKRHGCEGIREVRRPHLQRKGGYCSSRCAAIDTRNIAKADHASAGRMSALRRRQQLKARLATLSPLAIFRLGYTRGLQAKWRTLRKVYDLVPKQQGAA